MHENDSISLIDHEKDATQANACKKCLIYDHIIEDKAVFMANIIGITEVAVQYDWNGAINIEDICSIMDNESLGLPLERLIELNE